MIFLGPFLDRISPATAYEMIMEEYLADPVSFLRDHARDYQVRPPYHPPNLLLNEGADLLDGTSPYPSLPHCLRPLGPERLLLFHFRLPHQQARLASKLRRT
jgi:hypothetical protein